MFIILQIFFATHAILKIGEYPWIFPSVSWAIFGHVTCLDQSRASKKNTGRRIFFSSIEVFDGVAPCRGFFLC